MATFKQKSAFKEVVNGSTITSAMQNAGYALSTSKRTNKLTRTKGWLELVDKFLPDNLLTQKHLEGLDAYKTDKITLKIGGEEQLSLSNDPDFATRFKYLESAYKIKDKYPKEKADVTNQINIIGGVEINVRKNS